MSFSVVMNGKTVVFETPYVYEEKVKLEEHEIHTVAIVMDNQELSVGETVHKNDCTFYDMQIRDMTQIDFQHLVDAGVLKPESKSTKEKFMEMLEKANIFNDLMYDIAMPL